MTKKVLACLFLILAVLLAGCTKASDDGVSENAEKVISAMLNTPNSDLFSEAMISSIGMGVESPSEAEQSAQEAERQAIRDNWEAAVGDCFSGDSLDSFLASPAATLYLTNAMMTGTESEVLSLTLVSKDKYAETVLVDLSVNGESRQVTVVLSTNDDGKFWKVELQEN